MAQYQDVFARYEEKYLLEEPVYRKIREALDIYAEPDRYGQAFISNLYYDTPNHRLIRASLEKPVYKEKLRLRSYGVPESQSQVFIELKKKYEGIVYKRRTAMPLSEAEAYLRRSWSNAGRPAASQIEREISWTLAYYRDLRPEMYLSYDRLAFCGREDPSLRITFDSNLRFREEELDLRAGDRGEELLPPGMRLMEVKLPGSMPLWLAHLLDDCRLIPATFSKYGRAYEKARHFREAEEPSRKDEKQKKGGVNCA